MKYLTNGSQFKFSGVIRLVILTGMLGLYSCDYFKGPSSEEMVARVHDQYLYAQDLKGIIPPNTPASDSTLMINRYIENWVKQQVLVRQAIKTLPSGSLNFEKQLQDYRNSLIIFAWENDQVLNHLDTIITHQEISTFYDLNKQSFLLNESIVKISYIKTPLNAPDDRLVSRLIRSDEGSSLQELEEYCLQHAASYMLASESWLLFNDLRREVPIITDNPENYLRAHSMIELTDDYYRYYLRILDYKLKGSTAPMSFEQDNIRDLLLNQRKMQFMGQLRNKLFQDALENNSVEIFKR